MGDDFLSGRPPNLENILGEFDPSPFSNMTCNRLKEVVVGYEPRNATPSIDGRPYANEIFCFFPREDGLVEVPFAGRRDILIPLKPTLYGFDDNDIISIDPRGLDFELSLFAMTEYSSIAGLREIQVNQILESAGWMVNSSMRYDFEKVIALRESKGLDTTKYVELAKGYEAPEGTVITGICSDAGPLIRRCLSSLNIESRFVFTWVQTGGYDEDDTHNTTLFFDTTTGHWAVINSISPTKPYNLTPKDKIPELGYPYFMKGIKY